MLINKRAQCKGTYQDYLLIQSRRLLAQLSPEAKRHLAEQIQVRIILNGEKPVNHKVYQSILSRLREGNND